MNDAAPNDREAVQQAIDTIISSFSKHPHLCENGKNALQEFWNMKFGIQGDQICENAPIVYEYIETSGPPYICTVTLPGGACFATFQNCVTKSDARRSAALIALMNSVFNEHPTRRVTPEFIAKSVDSAKNKIEEKSLQSLEMYKLMLELCIGKTVLEFYQMMSIFQLLHWNGSFKAMKDRQCTREEVIGFYRQKVIDQEMRSQISLDWIVREQYCTGIINSELVKVNQEIDVARRNGSEMRYLKEKRDILLLALYQLDVEIKTN